MTQPVRVLLVEDNEGDVELMRTALDAQRVIIDLEVCTDGSQALTRLRRESPYEEAGLPDVVLLDLNLPGISGLQVLEAMQADVRLRTIPVIMVTTSEAETDVFCSYAQGANAFVTKPHLVSDFMDAMQTLGEFWFVVAKRRPEVGDLP